jgi:hypothetical protein
MMPLDDVCVEAEQLLFAVTSTMNAHLEAVRVMADLAGKHQPAQFQVAKECIDETSCELQNAMDEYKQHLREHGCSRPVTAHLMGSEPSAL